MVNLMQIFFVHQHNICISEYMGGKGTFPLSSTAVYKYQLVIIAYSL